MAECSIGRDWIQVRLERETHRQLRELAALWDAEGAKGRTDVPFNPDGPLSLNSVVRELLRRDHEHRRRSRKNSRSETTEAGTWDSDGRSIDRGPRDDS